MLGIEENIQAINFCEYYIGQDKTDIKFSLENFQIFDRKGEFLLNYNTETRRAIQGEELGFSIVNLNQLATFIFFYDNSIQYEKKLNVLDMIRFLDTKQIVGNDWINYYFQEKRDDLEYLIRISVYLSEFNKKQLLDIKLKTLLAIHNRIEQLEIEKCDNPLKKKVKRSEEKKKTANFVYTILVQDPNSVNPLKKPEVEIKQKEISKPKIAMHKENTEKIQWDKPPPEFEFQAKLDCEIQ